MLGYNNSSPAIEKVNGVFPGRIEFNIRLRGKGTAKMKLGKQHYECGYPHALIKMPDAEYSYFDLSERDIIYLCYESSLREEFEKLGFLSGDAAWDIERTPEIEFLLKKIKHGMNCSRESGVADRIDLDCFSLLNELFLQRSDLKKNSENSEQELIMRADSYLHFHVAECIDFDELAAMLGVSRSTFFRYWSKYFEETPAVYFMGLKLNEAVRLLNLNRYRIFEIAEMLKFSSAAYFCAVFRKKFGVTPQEYAAKNKNL